MDRGAIAPVARVERSQSLDALRGFALLGILVPNVVAFSWPGAAMMDYTVLGDTNMNLLAFQITQTAFLGKFMFIFAMLFGAGVLLYSRKFDDEPGTKLSRGAGLWYTRCAVLLGFGLIHAYLFWYGDILTWYAVAGLTLLWWVRRLPDWALLSGAVVSYLIGTVLLVGLSLLGLWALDQGHQTQEQLMGSNPESEIAAYLGTNQIGQQYGPWVSAFVARLPATLMMHVLLLPLFVPALWGLMMLGMYLLRQGVLDGTRSRRFYFGLGVPLLLVGAGVVLAAHAAAGRGETFRSSFLWQMMAQPIGIPLALGYTLCVVGLTTCAWFSWVTAALANVGRMALSNYLLQTVLCTTFFYGYGFGYFASLEYPALWGVIGGVWVLNIVFSALWLKTFRFGPVEWVWRCATYGRFVPILVKKG